LLIFNSSDSCATFWLQPAMFTTGSFNYSANSTNFARTTFKNTYFNRIVEMWNSIPLDITLSPSCAVFKSRMKKFLSEEWIFDLIFFSWLSLHDYLSRLATWWSVSHGVFHSFTDYLYGFACLCTPLDLDLIAIKIVIKVNYNTFDCR